jgi:hypothetical protein
MLRSRKRVILILVGLAAAAAIAAVVIGSNVASQPPSGAVTTPEDVSAQYDAFLERKHPGRGKVVTTLCSRTRHAYAGYPVFVCFATQRDSTGDQIVMQCVASTADGVVATESKRAGWPKQCNRESP